MCGDLIWNSVTVVCMSDSIHDATRQWFSEPPIDQPGDGKYIWTLIMAMLPS